MKINTARKWVDIVLWFDLCFITGTGLLMAYRLVPGSKGGHGLSLLGMDRHEWGTWHLWAAYLLLALVVVHLALNYACIVNVIACRKLWLAVALGVVGLAVALGFLFTPIQRSASGEGYRAGQGHGRGYGRGAWHEPHEE